MGETRAEFPIEQKLRQDIQEAQRARDQVRLDTLRMALGAIHNLEVARTDRKNREYGQPLTEADALKVLEQEVKKRSQTSRRCTCPAHCERNDAVGVLSFSLFNNNQIHCQLCHMPVWHNPPAKKQSGTFL